jgi:surfactin synthase thioesterase subunit
MGRQRRADCATIPTVPTRTPWIQPLAPRPSARLRLYCAPYAGGGAGVYRSWADALDVRIEVRAFLLPGRERRFTEPALSSVEELADSLVPELTPGLDPPYALFGHSLGAMLAYEVARRLTTAGRPPAHLLVSGAHAPHLPHRGPEYHRMADAEFVLGIKDLGGTPPELTEHAELLELLMPSLRADFTAAETYYHDAVDPLPCPITAFGGTEDPLVDRDELAGWSAHTTGAFRMHELPGDHFFLATARPALLQIVNRELTQQPAPS